MTTRIAGAILGLLFAAAVAHAQTTLLIAAPPADSPEQPTSMPDDCAQRDVNCVLNDGPPHWVPRRVSETTIPGATIPATGAGAGATAGAAAMGGAVGATTGGASAGFAGGR
jgi:hypothetical protein